MDLRKCLLVIALSFDKLLQVAAAQRATLCTGKELLGGGGGVSKSVTFQARRKRNWIGQAVGVASMLI